MTDTHADAMARMYMLILENDGMTILFARTNGTPRVHFDITATNLTPGGPPAALPAKKGSKTGGKGGKGGEDGPGRRYDC